MGSKLMNEVPQWIIVSLWLAVNIIVFVVYFLRFQTYEEYYYTRIMLGLSLPFARASAAAINLNSLLILLPVCRNLISYIRGSIFCMCCKRNVRRQLDKGIAFHKLCAYMIVVWTAVHYFAHTFNFERYWVAYDSPNNETAGLLSALSLLPSTPNGTWLNPIRTPVTNPMLELVKNVAGMTGVILTLALILMVSSSTEVIRRSYFEVFWFTHHLFIIYYIFLVTHGLGNVVRSQTNVEEHDPDHCYVYYAQWGAMEKCPLPQFAGSGAKSWMWVIGPMILYAIERTIRFVRSLQEVTITKIVKHPSNVIELRLQKKGFKMTAGQYIFLYCPTVSKLEWHPFTLTSAPQDDYFSVHIRVAGDWTRDLAKACQRDSGEVDAKPLLRLAVDGPFGTCSEDAYKYDVDMFVGAGIGVTPFASILKDIWLKQRAGSSEMKLRKVYLYWICGDTTAFEWFTDLLKSLEQEMVEDGREELLQYHIHLTRGWDRKIAFDIATHEHESYDVITGLRQKTLFGRPDWEDEFNKISRDNEGTRIGVFLCGPKVLSTTLRHMSNKFSSSDPKGTQFVFNEENF